MHPNVVPWDLLVIRGLRKEYAHDRSTYLGAVRWEPKRSILLQIRRIRASAVSEVDHRVP